MQNKNKKKHVPPIYVKESEIHGKGLFASRDISKAELIGQFKSKRASKDGPYVLWMEENMAYQVLDNFKYINHRNKANAAYYDDFTVMAIRNIKKDEEITHYYGEDWGD